MFLVYVAVVMVCSCWLYVLNSFPSPFFGSLFTFSLFFLSRASRWTGVDSFSYIPFSCVLCCVELDGWNVRCVEERVFCIYNTFCHVWCVWIVGKRGDPLPRAGRGGGRRRCAEIGCAVLWWCVCSIRRIKLDIRSVLDVNKHTYSHATALVNKHV